MLRLWKVYLANGRLHSHVTQYALKPDSQEPARVSNRKTWLTCRVVALSYIRGPQHDVTSLHTGLVVTGIRV